MIDRPLAEPEPKHDAKPERNPSLEISGARPVLVQLPSGPPPAQGPSITPIILAFVAGATLTLLTAVALGVFGH
jgi:hypothetical protein